jgi:hypothetical protein
MIERAFVMDVPALTLKSGWAWLYWLFETGIIVTTTTWSSYTTARQPFSESAQDWYGQATMVGGVKKGFEQQFL